MAVNGRPCKRKYFVSLEQWDYRSHPELKNSSSITGKSIPPQGGWFAIRKLLPNFIKRMVWHMK